MFVVLEAIYLRKRARLPIDMQLAQVRRHALSLPEVTEEPHFQYSSFRVRGKIFVTVPPDEKHIHVFVGEEQRAPVLAMYPEFIEKLTWGAKVVGLRITLAAAASSVVSRLISLAWLNKAPKSLAKAHADLLGRL